MNVAEALNSRLSVREFLDTPVPARLIGEILERARQAPSGGNVQPWRVYVLEGPARDALVARVARRIAAGVDSEGTEYHIYPPELTEPYRSRRYRCGMDLYAAVNISREDRPARRRQWLRNYEFFGAPAGLIFVMDWQFQQGQWADLGMFMQSIMLLAREHGLDTCPQEAWANWHRTLREFLRIPDNYLVFAGMALGYRDPDAPVNQLRTERAPVEEFATFVTAPAAGSGGAVG